jgi:hypothetical protein
VDARLRDIAMVPGHLEVSLARAIRGGGRQGVATRGLNTR